MVDTTDLKSVEACPRAGSSPAFRTRTYILTQGRARRLFFLCVSPKKKGGTASAFPRLRLKQLFARALAFIYLFFLPAFRMELFATSDKDHEQHRNDKDTERRCDDHAAEHRRTD